MSPTNSLLNQHEFTQETDNNNLNKLKRKLECTDADNQFSTNGTNLTINNKQAKLTKDKSAQKPVKNSLKKQTLSVPPQQSIPSPSKSTSPLSLMTGQCDNRKQLSINGSVDNADMNKPSIDKSMIYSIQNLSSPSLSSTSSTSNTPSPSMRSLNSNFSSTQNVNQLSQTNSLLTALMLNNLDPNNFVKNNLLLNNLSLNLQLKSLQQQQQQTMLNLENSSSSKKSPTEEQAQNKGALDLSLPNRSRISNEFAKSSSISSNLATPLIQSQLANGSTLDMYSLMIKSGFSQTLNNNNINHININNNPSISNQPPLSSISNLSDSNKQQLFLQNPLDLFNKKFEFNQDNNTNCSEQEMRFENSPNMINLTSNNIENQNHEILFNLKQIANSSSGNGGNNFKQYNGKLSIPTNNQTAVADLAVKRNANNITSSNLKNWQFNTANMLPESTNKNLTMHSQSQQQHPQQLNQLNILNSLINANPSLATSLTPQVNPNPNTFLMNLLNPNSAGGSTSSQASNYMQSLNLYQALLNSISPACDSEQEKVSNVNKMLDSLLNYTANMKMFGNYPASFSANMAPVNVVNKIANNISTNNGGAQNENNTNADQVQPLSLLNKLSTLSNAAL